MTALALLQHLQTERVAHILSDKIYERLTGEEGYFDTRIIFVAESGPKNQRVKKLAIMDQDGANTKYLTLGNELVLTPRFNPTNQMVTYMSYFRNMPRVYLLDIETGNTRRSRKFPRNDFCSQIFTRWKEDCNEFCKGREFRYLYYGSRYKSCGKNNRTFLHRYLTFIFS